MKADGREGSLDIHRKYGDDAPRSIGGSPSDKLQRVSAPCFGVLEKERDEQSSSRSIFFHNSYAEITDP